MPFSLSQAISGFGGSVAHDIDKNMENERAINLVQMQAQIQKERDARINDYQRGNLVFAENIKRQAYQPVTDAMDAAGKPVTVASEEGDYTTPADPKLVLRAGLQAAIKNGNADVARILHDMLQPKYHTIPKEGAVIDQDSGKVINGPGTSQDEIEHLRAQTKHEADSGAAALMQGRAALTSANSLAALRAQSAAQKPDKMDEIDKLDYNGLRQRVHDTQTALQKGGASRDEQWERRFAAEQASLDLNRFLVKKGAREGDPYDLAGIPNVTKAMEGVIDFLNKDPTQADLQKRRSLVERRYGNDADPILELLDTYDSQYFQPKPKRSTSGRRGIPTTLPNQSR